MSYFNKGEYFPPVDHQDRIIKYREHKLLAEGNHWELFRKYNVAKSGKGYISVNLAGIIAKKSADFLIGDGVSVSAGKEDNSKEQMAFDRLREDNDLDILFYESALGNAYRGDSFFKVRYGQEFAGLYPEEFDAKRVRIEAISAESVFPEVAKHNRNLITAYHIAVPIRVSESEDITQPKNFKLQVESHYLGKIEYHEYELSVMATYTDGTPKEYKIGKQIGQTQQVKTGVPSHLVVHIPNFGSDDTWEGIDDLSDMRSLFDELNNRLSQVASIMDKHSNPALAVGMGILTEDEQGRPIFNVADSKVFEIDGKQDIIPQYITWNGQLTEAYSEIDRLISLILTTAEIPEVALGMGDSGTSGSSGLAIKWRMNSLLSKIKRKRKYYEKGLKRIFMVAQYLEQVTGVADYEMTQPKLIFTDGLPKDEMEQTNIHIQKTGGAVLMSQKTAIMKLEGLTEEQADAELERIKEEQDAKAESEATASPSIFNDMDFGADTEEGEE